MAKKKKENILQEADRITSSDRAQAYGPAKENFDKIAKMWSAYKGVEFVARDIPMMMTLVKISRDSHKPKRDNLTDIAGYARTAEMCEE